MITLIGGEKGGTGKTTTAVNLAAFLTKIGERVLIVDTDMQMSAWGWAQIRKDTPKVTPIDAIKLYGEINRQLPDIILDGLYTQVIIDAGGRDSEELRSSMLIADKMYSPIRASQFDVMSLSKLDKLSHEVRAFKSSNFKPIIFVNCGSTNPKVKDANYALDYIDQYACLMGSLCVLKERAAYRKSGNQGLGVNELHYKEYNMDAFLEMNKLCEEIYDVSL